MELLKYMFKEEFEKKKLTNCDKKLIINIEKQTFPKSWLISSYRFILLFSQILIIHLKFMSVIWYTFKERMKLKMYIACQGVKYSDSNMYTFIPKDYNYIHVYIKWSNILSCIINRSRWILSDRIFVLNWYRKEPSSNIHDEHDDVKKMSSYLSQFTYCSSFRPLRVSLLQSRATTATLRKHKSNFHGIWFGFLYSARANQRNFAKKNLQQYQGIGE